MSQQDVSSIVNEFVQLGGTINGMNSAPMILNWLNGLSDAQKQIEINVMIAYIKANGG